MGRMLDIDEISTILGVKPLTVRSWRRRKTGPPLFLVEGALRCDEDDLNAYIAAQKAATLTGGTAEGGENKRVAG